MSYFPVPNKCRFPCFLDSRLFFLKPPRSLLGLSTTSCLLIFQLSASLKSNICKEWNIFSISCFVPLNIFFYLFFGSDTWSRKLFVGCKHLKAHQQISKKWCFQKYCSSDQAHQFSALQSKPWQSYLENLTIDEKYINKRVRLCICQTMCQEKIYISTP